MALVARQVVDDDDVTRRERRHEDLSHVLQEALAIDGAVAELGGGYAAQPQPGNERGLLAAPVRDRRAQAHASRRAALGARPYRRAMLVEAKLSSTNTSFAGSRSSWA